MSSFTVSGTSVTFTTLETGFSDVGGALEEITVGVEFESATDWGAFFSLRSWNVTSETIPGGDTVYVDIGGGAGEGYLQIDNLDSHNAILIGEKLTRSTIEPGSLRSIARATFLITS